MTNTALGSYYWSHSVARPYVPDGRPPLRLEIQVLREALMEDPAMEQTYTIVQKIARDLCCQAQKCGSPYSIEAEDLAQAVMVRLLDTDLMAQFNPNHPAIPHQKKGGSPKEAFLYVIVRGVAKNYRRADQRQHRRDAEGGDSLYRTAVRVSLAFERSQTLTRSTKPRRRLNAGIAAPPHEPTIVAKMTAQKLCDVIERQLTPDTVEVFRMLREGAERQEVRETVGWRRVMTAEKEMQSLKKRRELEQLVCSS